MRARTVRHQHRHFKTLILLVLSMTGGTFFLFWVGGLAPVTPLRGKMPAAKVWTQISVRAGDARSPEGFFHFRIDEAGQLSQSGAWKAGRDDPQTPGTIHVLVSGDSPETRLAPTQARVLTELIAELRATHGIRTDQVQVRRQP